jgi:hypothetical protein
MVQSRTTRGRERDETQELVVADLVAAVVATT